MGSHDHSAERLGASSQRAIAIAFALNLSFSVFELIGGLVAGSSAIIADAIHDFGDAITLGVALALQRLAGNKANSKFTYGFGRLSLLSALLAGTVLAIGSIAILYKTVPQFWNPEPAPSGPIMIGLAIVGVTVNYIAAVRLRKGTTTNEKVLSWHLIEDLLGWVSVLIGAIVITITKWQWVDPLLACGIAIFILFNVSRSLTESVRLFLQSIPEGFDSEAMKKNLERLRGVRSIHELHAWTLDGTNNILTVHVAIDPDFANTDVDELKRSMRSVIQANGQFHVTIETETADDKDFPEDHEHQ